MKKILFLLLFICGALSVVSAQNLEFDSVRTNSGLTSFALDSSSGQAWFMRDFGRSAGEWISYGNTIEHSGSLNLAFKIIKTESGTGFFALDTKHGRLYYMWDYGRNSGKWNSYGPVLDAEGAGDYGFSMSFTENGGVYYAYNKISGQMHYMKDSGNNSGKWYAYGKTIN